MHPSDAELVELARAGSKEAFGRLVTRYQGAVHATAQCYAGRYGAADDIVQESFWAAYRSLRSLRRPEQFAPWLKGITTRTAANWLRRNMSRVRRETPLSHGRPVPVEDGRAWPDAAANTVEQLARVQEAIESLPEPYRLPVVLRYMQEMSYEEISSFTGDTVDEVRGTLRRAMRQLREWLKDEETTEVVVPWRRVRK